MPSNPQPPTAKLPNTASTPCQAIMAMMAASPANNKVKAARFTRFTASRPSAIADVDTGSTGRRYRSRARPESRAHGTFFAVSAALFFSTAGEFRAFRGRKHEENVLL